MSNGYTLELSRWGGDDEVHLVFWDVIGSLGDQNYVLLKSGEVFKEVWDEEKEGFERVEVDLAFELLNLEKELNASHSR